MCNGQPNAVKPTHSTIQATLELWGSSQLAVPRPSSSGVTTTASTALVTMTPPAYTPPATSTPKTTAVPAPLPTESNLSSTPVTDGNGEQQKTPPKSTGLTTPQIAGLAAGLVAAFAIAFLTICISRRRRKKYFPDTETGFFMKKERLRALSRHFSMQPKRRNERIYEISAPIHGTPPPRFPMGKFAAEERRPAPAVPRLSLPVEELVSPVVIAQARPVVLAAVAKSNNSSEQPKTQKRPTLSLAIPKSKTSPQPVLVNTAQNNIPKREDGKPKLTVNTSTAMNGEGSSAAKPTIRPVSNSENQSQESRDVDDSSPMTEFEEDGSGDISPTQIWRPPSAVPQSATAVYVADKFGNWVLADERQKRRISRVELDGGNPVTRNLTARRASNVAPRNTESKTTVLTQPAPAPPTTIAQNYSAQGTLRPPAEIYRQENGDVQRVASVASSAAYPPSSVYPPSATYLPPTIYTDNAGPWNISGRTPPVPGNPLVPKPLNPRQKGRNDQLLGQNLAPRQQQPPRASAYSPVLNPFLDASGVSPVRTIAPHSGPWAPMSRMVPPPPAQSYRPPQQPSPTLGFQRAPVGPQNPTQVTSTPVTAAAAQAAYVQQYTYPAEAQQMQTTRGTPPSSQPSALLEKRLGPDRATSLSNLAISSAAGDAASEPQDNQPGPYRRMVRDAESGEYRSRLPSTPSWRPLLTPERRGDALYLSLR